MFPFFSVNYCKYGRSANPVFFAKLWSGNAFLFFFSYLNDLIWRKLSVFFCVPGIAAPPALSRHILRIILFTAKKQMSWVDAPRVVAPVKHAVRFFNRTSVMHEGQPVCENISATYSKHAIAILVFGPNPLPTFVERYFLYFTKKLFINRFHEFCIGELPL